MIAGSWISSEPKLWFVFQQQGSEVRGSFHDEKVFTCELKGAFAGNQLNIHFETIFSWLNVHESGSAVLELAPDGAMLAGPFKSNGKSGLWRLRREGVQPQASVPPARPPAPPNIPFPIPPHRSPSPQPIGAGKEPFSSYRDRITIDVSEAPHDPALLQHLRRRARFEPELDALLKAHKLDR
ncbi:MAG TPA: hypothetical protein VGH73_13950 [Thermoanaerobaculia bacterium]